MADRRRWVVRIVAVLLVVGGLAVSLTAILSVHRDTPVEVVEKLADLHTCGDVRALVSDHLWGRGCNEVVLDHYVALGPWRLYRIEHESVAGGTAEVAMVAPKLGIQAAITIRLVKQDGEWRIDDLDSLNPLVGLS